MVSACQWSLCPSVQVSCVKVELLVFHGQCLLVVLVSLCATQYVVLQWKCLYSMVIACELSLCPSVQVSCVIVEVLVFHGQCLLVVIVSFYADILCFSGSAGIPRLVLASGLYVLLCRYVVLQWIAGIPRLVLASGPCVLLCKYVVLQWRSWFLYG